MNGMNYAFCAICEISGVCVIVVTYFYLKINIPMERNWMLWHNIMIVHIFCMQSHP